MKDLYDVRGVKVVETTAKPRPFNPLNRPEIHIKKVILAILGFLFLIVGTYRGIAELGKRVEFIHGHAVIHNIFESGWNISVICTVIAVLLYLHFISKKAIIWSIHVYQHFAPDKVRLACVFEPSCSEYMILAVKKYGSIRGVLKGIHRLKRCHYPNYGKDYP